MSSVINTAFGEVTRNEVRSYLNGREMRERRKCWTMRRPFAPTKINTEQQFMEEAEGYAYRREESRIRKEMRVKWQSAKAEAARRGAHRQEDLLQILRENGHATLTDELRRLYQRRDNARMQPVEDRGNTPKLEDVQEPEFASVESQ